MTILLEVIVTLKDILTAWSSAICQFFIPPKPKNVSGEVVLVTGGGRGLGRQLALEFAMLKSVVVVWDIDDKLAMETKRLVEKTGGICHVFVCDVRYELRSFEKVNLFCFQRNSVGGYTQTGIMSLDKCTPPPK